MGMLVITHRQQLFKESCFQPFLIKNDDWGLRERGKAKREDVKMINVVIREKYYVTVTNVFNLGLFIPHM